MLKVLRKYNKFILVIFGSVLMVAFLMPQAIQQLGKARMSRAVAMMDGHKVTAAHMDEATRELAALREFFDTLQRPFPLPLDSKKRVEHWLLLTREAQQEGLVGGADEGATLLPIFAQSLVESYYMSKYQQFGSSARQIAQYAMSQQPDEVKKLTNNAMQILANARAQAAGRARMSGDQFDAGLARLQGVTRLLNEYRTAERISDKQTIEIAKSLADSALIDAVFLSGRELADKTLEPTPEQLAAHFEKFKTFNPGEGEYGMGYKLPPRVKVEWIALDRPTIEQAITIPLPDAIKYFKLNQDRFEGDFDANRQTVEAELVKAKADQVMDSAESIIRAEVARALRPLKKDGDYRVLPDDWDQRKPDFLKIADMIPPAVKEAQGVDIPKPAVYIKNDQWLDGQRLQGLPGIGAATLRVGQTRGTFPQFALSVRELVGDSILGLQVGIPNIAVPATDPQGSKYFFTILDAAPSEVAKDYTEYLYPKKLVSDWRALQRYEQLVAKLPEYRQLAEHEGLDALAKSFGTIDEPTAKTVKDIESDNDAAQNDQATTENQDTSSEQDEQADDQSASETDADTASNTDKAGDQADDDTQTEPTHEPLPRVSVMHNASVFENRTNGLMLVENNKDVIKAVLDTAKDIDPLVSIETIPIADRMVDTKVPIKLGVFIAQINGVQPLTREQLPRYADSAVAYRQSQFMDRRSFPIPFLYEPLSQRHGFKEIIKKNDADAVDEPSPDSQSSDESATPPAQ